jgi:DNA-directed RNA polymerase omega subunit
MAYPLIVDSTKLKNLNLRNRYELIIVAAKRSRQLRDGSKSLTNCSSDKEPVISLQEVLEGRVQALKVPRHKENEHTSE